MIRWFLTPAAFAAVTVPVFTLAGIDLVQRRTAVSRWFAAAPLVTFLLGFVQLWRAWGAHRPIQGWWLDLLEVSWRSFWPASFAAGACALGLAASRALAPPAPVVWRRLLPGVGIAGLLGVVGQLSATGYHAVAIGIGAGGTGLIGALSARGPSERVEAAGGAVFALHLTAVLLIVWCGWLEDVSNTVGLPYGYGEPRLPYWRTGVPVALLPLALLACGLRPTRSSLGIVVPPALLALAVTVAFAYTRP
ncbi:MAG: hypothetical protein R3F61_32665 [Myxococcota bacterium]